MVQTVLNPITETPKEVILGLVGACSGAGDLAQFLAYAIDRVPSQLVPQVYPIARAFLEERAREAELQSRKRGLRIDHVLNATSDVTFYRGMIARWDALVQAETPA